MYNFVLSASGKLNKTCHPRYSDTFSYNKERQKDEVYFLKTVSEAIRFTGEDYDWIMSCNLTQKITITVSFGVITNYIVGVFSKSKCEIDVDKKLIEVSITVDETMNKILSIMDSEVYLRDIKTKQTDFNPYPAWMIQIYAENDTKCTNYIGGDYFEQDCRQMDAEEIASNMVFEPTNRLFSAVHTLATVRGFTSPIVGSWFSHKGYFNFSLPDLGETESLALVKQTGDFILNTQRKENSYEIRLVIKTHPSNKEIYTSQYFDSQYFWVHYGNNNRLEDVVFTKTFGAFTGPTSFSFAESRLICMRFLGISEWTGLPEDLLDVSNDDYFSENEVYTNLLALNSQKAASQSFYIYNYLFDNSLVDNDIEVALYINNFFLASLETTTRKTKWNIAANNQYFLQPQQFSYDYHWRPIGQTVWGYASLWFRLPTDELNLLQTPAINIYKSNMKCFLLSDILDAIFRNFGLEINVSSVDSYFTKQNPYTKYVGYKLAFIEGGMLRKGVTAGRKAITLRMILDFLKVQNVYFDFENKVLINHKKFFETEQGTTDVTTRYYLRGEKSWDYGQYKYSYELEDKPKFQKYECEGTSPVFDDFSFVRDVENSNSETKTSYISTNFNEVLATNKDIWLAVSLDEQNSVKLASLNTVKGRIFVRNGLLSFTFLGENFLPYGEYDVKYQDMNGILYQLSFDDNKVYEKKQTLTFPTKSDLSLKNLYTTNVGSGIIKKIIVYLEKRYSEIEICHDTFND